MGGHKIKISITLALFALLVFSFQNFSDDPISSLSHSHIPSHVSSSIDQGKVDPTIPVTFSVAVNLRNQGALNIFIKQLYDPQSPNYHKFLNPQQFAQQFGPSMEDFSTLIRYFTKVGVTQTNSVGNVLTFQGSAANVQAAFNFEMHNYRTRNRGTLYAPASEPKVPSSVAELITGISGLNQFAMARSYIQHVSPTKPSTIGTGPNGGLSPSDIKKAYAINTSLTGSRQTLALYELDGYTASDITGYASAFGISNPPPLQNILVDGYSGAAGSGADEVTLDIELMMAIAPGATKILVYEGANGTANLDLFSKMAGDNLAKVISTSWGTAEGNVSSGELNAENTIFTQMASQGQTILAAAGDHGADDNGTSLSVDDPGSQPFVVSAGGTTLSLTSGNYLSESSWGVTSAKQGGGGGISNVWPMPSWQAGLATTANKGSNSMRMVPDISMEANPNNGYAIYFNGKFGNLYGGTSCSAPLWAALMGLVNQQRTINGLGPIGFANPAIYNLAKSSAFSQDFHDINDSSTNLFYPAVTGYDLSTGWGSMNGATLIPALGGGGTVPPTPTNFQAVQVVF